MSHKRPITITIDIDEAFFDYTVKDFDVIAQALAHQLKLLSDQGGEPDQWVLKSEPLELNAITGIRLTLEGQEA